MVDRQQDRRTTLLLSVLHCHHNDKITIKIDNKIMMKKIRTRVRRRRRNNGRALLVGQSKYAPPPRMAKYPNTADRIDEDCLHETRYIDTDFFPRATATMDPSTLLELLQRTDDEAAIYHFQILEQLNEVLLRAVDFVLLRNIHPRTFYQHCVKF